MNENVMTTIANHAHTRLQTAHVEHAEHNGKRWTACTADRVNCFKFCSTHAASSRSDGRTFLRRASSTDGALVWVAVASAILSFKALCIEINVPAAAAPDVLGVALADSLNWKNTGIQPLRVQHAKRSSLIGNSYRTVNRWLVACHCSSRHAG